MDMTTLASVFENIITTLEEPLHTKKKVFMKNLFSKAEQEIQ